MDSANDSQKELNPHPFQYTAIEGDYSVVAAIESEALFTTYYPFFESRGYIGNGYCWEGHIIQIIEKEDRELLNHIDFNSEAGAFCAYIDSKATLVRFIELIAPVFTDVTLLDDYVKVADRSRIDD